MRSLPTVVALIAAAVLQAMGMYEYTDDSIALSGQVFFPLIFGLMAVYLAWRTKGTPRFGLVHAILLLLGLAAVVVTFVGKYALVFALYPSPYVYYAAFAVLVVELFFRILAMPKKPKEDAERTPRRTRRRRRPAGAGPTHLVARAKGSQGGRDAAEPDDADDEADGAVTDRAADAAGTGTASAESRR